MKRHLVPLLALGATFVSAGYVLGQTQAKSGTPAANAPTQQMKLVRVATLKTAEANREFQNNVQVMTNLRKAAVDLQSDMEKEKDAKKKAELKAKFDAALAKLNENNQLMLKTYGFSIERNYVMEIEVSNVYLMVTEEEAAKLEKAEADKKSDKKADKKKK